MEFAQSSSGEVKLPLPQFYHTTYFFLFAGPVTPSSMGFSRSYRKSTPKI